MKGGHNRKVDILKLRESGNEHVIEMIARSKAEGTLLGYKKIIGL